MRLDLTFLGVGGPLTTRHRHTNLLAEFYPPDNGFLPCSDKADGCPGPHFPLMETPTDINAVCDVCVAASVVVPPPDEPFRVLIGCGPHARVGLREMGVSHAHIDAYVVPNLFHDQVGGLVEAALLNHEVFARRLVKGSDEDGESREDARPLLIAPAKFVTKEHHLLWGLLAESLLSPYGEEIPPGDRRSLETYFRVVGGARPGKPTLWPGRGKRWGAWLGFFDGVKPAPNVRACGIAIGTGPFRGGGKVAYTANALFDEALLQAIIQTIGCERVFYDGGSRSAHPNIVDEFQHITALLVHLGATLTLTHVDDDPPSTDGFHPTVPMWPYRFEL